ncbi:MAG: hypothetical protein WAT39_19160 [Planctomycetota bacterium]
MTKQKDLKRLIRARMQKTGESYTSARVAVLAKRPVASNGAVGTAATALAEPPRRVVALTAAAATSAAATAKPSTTVKPAEFATLAGMSDAAVKKATGCTWEKWVKALDHHGAAALPHAAIVRLIDAKYHIAGWWAQTVTVGYERIRGLRAKGQRRSGKFDISKSRTFAVPIEQLYDAFTPGRLPRWLDGQTPALRTTTRPKSMRLKWHDGTTVDIHFWRKGPAKTQVALGHQGFANRADAERMRAWWTDRFGALGEELARA